MKWSLNSCSLRLAFKRKLLSGYAISTSANYIVDKGFSTSCETCHFAKGGGGLRLLWKVTSLEDLFILGTMVRSVDHYHKAT